MPYSTEDETEGKQRYAYWLDPSRKWSCRLNLIVEANGDLSAHIVTQPSGEVPIDG